MDRSAIRNEMSALIAGHVPRNARAFKFRIFDDQPNESTLGFVIDPKPFDGKVIAMTETAVIVKTGRVDFAVLDRDLVAAIPDVGAKVHVCPYARHRFDGLRADTPQERTEYTQDGTPYTIQTHVLGSAPAKLPIPAPQCPELRDMIEQLEELPASDRFRCITHQLVDAGGRDFTWVEPAPGRIIETPPAISFTVATAKVAGRVSVLYDRAADTYVVELRRDGALVERIDDVYVDSLGDVLAGLIDDGRWRQIHVNVLDVKASRKKQAIAA